MGAARRCNLPDLLSVDPRDMALRGHGLNLKREHYARVLDGGALHPVDWFEIVSENFFHPGGRPWAVLERLRQLRPVALHGTAMGLGNLHGVPADYLRRLKELIDRVEPSHVSDHLCFVGDAEEYTHELLPLPFTEAAARHVSDQISRVQDFLGCRIAVENVSAYLRFEADEFDEIDFLKAVAERADCHLLLDLNNLWVNGQNHGFDPVDQLARLPAERIIEFHLSGASFADGVWFDTHVGPVPNPVWQLYRHALAHVGPRPTLVEWDTDVPDYETAAAECARAARIERLREAA